MGRNSRTPIIAAAFVVGLLVGWLVIGWWLYPVQWTNAYLQDLAPQDRQAALQWIAEGYELTGNQALAEQRAARLGNATQVGEAMTGLVQQAEESGDPDATRRVRSLSAALGMEPAGEEPPPGAEGTPPGSAETPDERGGFSLLTACAAGLGIFILLGGIALAVWLLSERRAGQQPSGGASSVAAPLAEPVAPIRRDVLDRPVVSPPSISRRPLVQEFAAAFNAGDDSYDESFDIEAPEEGVYLGECGMAVSEVVNGDPDRVTALEVWLFDKSDIRTVTTVLMSEYAFNNQVMREKLSARGEVVLAEPGLGFVLDAQTLRLEGQVTALKYVEGEGPDQSIFRRLNVVLKVTRQGPPAA